MLPFIAEYHMQDYKEKHWLKIWSGNSKDPKINHLHYEIFIVSYFCNTKHKVPDYLKSHIVYKFYCPACNKEYIVQKDQNLSLLVQEHSS